MQVLSSYIYINSKIKKSKKQKIKKTKNQKYKRFSKMKMKIEIEIIIVVHDVPSGDPYGLCRVLYINRR